MLGSSQPANLPTINWSNKHSREIASIGGVSEDELPIEPLFLVAADLDVQFGVVSGLFDPLSISLAEKGLHGKEVQVDHLVVKEGRVAEFW